jgi:competence protein ComEC
VAAALLLIARLMRVSRSAAALISLTGSAAYVLLLGAPYAALRALFQMALLLGSRSLQRPAHPLGLLSAAAVAVTLIDPAAPLDAGFQLSFAGICGIVLWRRPLIDLMPDSIPVPVRDAIATTCAATAITTPIAGFHFGTVSLIALVANLLAIPVVTLAVPTAAAALAISAVSMDVARSVAAGSELTLLWLNAIAQKCAAVPGAHFAVTPLQVAAGTMAVAAAYWTTSHIRIFTNSQIPTRATAATLAGLIPLIVLAPGATQTLAIHMIDVGQGDAIAIQSPRGHWLLVDAGPASDRFNAGKSQVVPFLLRHQASRVSAVILSHPHLDHFGGLAAVSERIRIGAIIDPGMAVTSAEYDSMLAAAERTRLRWLRAHTGSTIDFDGASIQFLAPDTVPLDARADANEYSLVMRIDYGEFSALFLGDLPAAQEKDLVTRYGARLDVDLLKVAHHGSGGSSSAELLLAASPDVALVPVGRRNRYRHPHAAALARLEQSGARIFRTDVDGSVTVHGDAAGRIAVETRQ